MSPQEFENQVRALLNSLTSVPVERIRPVVRQTLEILGSDAPHYDDKDQFIEQVAKSLEAKLNLSMPDATVIKLPFAEWLAERRTSTEMFYWDRYRRYLAQSGFSNDIVGTIGRDTDKIVGLLENPSKKGEWKRRGLVVGHVQSGKTANYSGVICKAADYGYKVIILLAGVHNNLRSQTQQRLEESFIGVDTDKLDKNLPFSEVKTGVGKISDVTRIPFSLTSREFDFRTSSKKASNFSLGSVSEPIIFVIKKQTSVLKNLIEWLNGLNETRGGKILSTPMLLIDDEADNASINTASQESDPTRINSLIRQLLALFEQTSYVGYTATPFANIFIDPDSEHEMLEDDLFPRHFIITLDAPDNYVSAARIFGDDGDLRPMIVPVGDHLEFFPEKHKITHTVDGLPESLMEAVRRFVIGRAIRILRQRGQDHSSMLVNVSRFNTVQKQVTSLISHYLEELLNSVKLHHALPDSEALGDPGMLALYRTFEDMEVIGETWSQVKARLPQAVGTIVVRLINNKSADRLDYRNHRENGLHVIAVGGLSLSRGFTLEGLSVSYFIRNSIMYDTLLQMGRWFGYRDGYLDLCSLYMTDEAVSWYSHISSAIDELRTEFRLMEQLNRCPEDFGLKVRTHPDSLIITARNKMRTGKKVPHSVSLGGRLVETSLVKSSPSSVEANFSLLKQLVKDLESSKDRLEQKGLGYVWTDVGADVVCSFLSKYDTYINETSVAQPDRVLEFIRQDSVCQGKWDICLYGIASGTPADLGVLKIGQQVRGTISGGRYYQVSGTKSRVASKGAERAGLTLDQLNEARVAAGNIEDIPDIYYRMVRTRPLLMLHVLDLRHESAKSPIKLADNVCVWGVSFPGTRDPNAKRGVLVSYLVNTVFWKENYGDDLEDTSDE